MIRPLTLVSALLFVGSGLYLYQTKHQAQMMDREIRRVRDTAEAIRERAGVLRAEYALLNDPERLTELASAHLPTLKATVPTQWSSMAELERRLPPVGHVEAEPTPLEVDETTPGGDAPDLPVPPLFAPPPPILAAHVAIATPSIAVTPRPAAVGAIARATPHPTVARAPDRSPQTAQAVAAPQAPRAEAVAQAVPPPTAAVQVNVARGSGAPADPRPVARTTVAAATFAYAPPRLGPPRSDTYVPPPATPAEAIARIARGGPVDASLPVVASALGMARTMMAVTPVSPASAAALYPQGTSR